jgi:hypothetical protein
MSSVGQTTNPGRIIVRYQGVGLSMLRNVKNDGIKNRYERNNQYLKLIFVTLVNKNSVSATPSSPKSKIPSKAATAYYLVNRLWKTAKIPVENLWNR